jgi:SWIM zinc finger
VTPRVLADGSTVVAGGDGGRIGAGPWARWLASAAVPDESTLRAERGRRLAREGAVGRLEVVEGSITARVTGSTGNEYDVTIAAAPVPADVWSQAARATRGRSVLEDGATGRAQSVHLAHLLETRFGTRFAPSAREIRRSCTCPDTEPGGACKHIAAAAFVVADAIDRDPSLFLHWRGCTPLEPRPADPWRSGTLPLPAPPRPLPPAAVLRRLGRSGIRTGGVDLADALEPAYRLFAATGTNTP